MLSNCKEAQVCSRSTDRLREASTLVPSATSCRDSDHGLIIDFTKLLFLHAYAKVSQETMSIHMEDTHSTAASGFRGLVVSIL